jgi:RNA polymerase sigma factor FliA
VSLPLKTPAQLIFDCQGLVRSLAWQIHCKLPSHVELEDLVSYGQIGLAEAARDFDPERASQFTTYAYYRIRGAIFDGLSKMSWFSRVDFNRGVYENRPTLAAPEELTADEGSDSKSDSGDAEKRGALELVQQLCHSFAEGEAGDVANEEGSTQTPPDMAIEREMVQKLHELIEALPEQARTLIRAAYFEGLTLKDAGERLGMSKAWASRLHSKTLGQLAQSFRMSRMDD